MTQTIDQRARELLAKHYELSGTHHYAERLRNGYQGQPQALAALTEALTKADELEPTVLGLQNAYRLLILTAKERGLAGHEDLYHELCNLEYNMVKLQKATGIGDIYEATLTKGIKE